MNLVASICPGSVLSHYVSSRPENEPVPNVSRIRQATNQYYQKNNNKELSRVIWFVEKKDTLTVHVRSGDRPTRNSFIQAIKKLSGLFKHVVLLSGVHLDQHYHNHDKKKESFVATMNKILDKSGKFIIVMDTPDNHLCVMKRASNLLVHMGGFSALGGIVAEGKVFYTGEFSHASAENWRQHVKKQMTEI